MVTCGLGAQFQLYFFVHCYGWWGEVGVGGRGLAQMCVCVCVCVWCMCVCVLSTSNLELTFFAAIWVVFIFHQGCSVY